MDRIGDYWREFLIKKGLPEDTLFLEAFHFDLTEKWANLLLDLVLAGKKRATASSMYFWEIEGKMPRPGDYSIVTDWKGTPRCVIKTTKITVLPFRDVDFDLCVKEGEDDCLESWQKGHRNFFTAEGRELNYAFSEDMTVVFEEFDVVYQ
ncbi:MAG TPA: ASCH domain-containing protein [Clostridia bacterium]|nr:ASCH domain-containing protein [Clostridia bacterium]